MPSCLRHTGKKMPRFCLFGEPARGVAVLQLLAELRWCGVDAACPLTAYTTVIPAAAV